MSSKPGRLVINWRADERVQIAQSVCRYVVVELGVTGAVPFMRLWRRLYPLATGGLLGRALRFEHLQRHVRQTQGREITEHKLLQRGDKAWRYDESNATWPRVRAVLRRARPS